MQVKDNFGNNVSIRAALDSLAQVNLIRNDVVTRLGLRGSRKKLNLAVAGGQTAKSDTTEVEIQIQPSVMYTNGVRNVTMNALTINEITSPFDPVNINPKHYQHLKDLEFSIKYPEKESVQIDLLIGEPWYSFLEQGEVRKGKLDEPAASLTKFGWVLTGNNPSEVVSTKITLVNTSANENQEFKDQIEKFFLVENLGIEDTDTDFTHDEQEAVDMMHDITRYDERECRWETGLLWKKNPHLWLKSNQFRAEKVMESMKKRATGWKEAAVEQAFKDMLADGTLEIIPPNQIKPQGNQFVYYLETLAVFREDHPSTKCRIVMNASSNNPETLHSLNTCLYQGPCRLPSVALAQLRFRIPSYVFIADVSKMFLQIGIMDRDRDALRVQYRFGNDTEVTHMRMTKVTFGINSSPFQADYCAKESAEQFRNIFPSASNTILQQSYVDDVVGNGETIEDTNRLLREVRIIYDHAHMKLHKITANHPEIRKQLQSDEASNPSEWQGVLGAQWLPADDVLTFNFAKKEAITNFLQDKGPLTRRKALSIVASLFDATGLAAPVIVVGKQLQRDVWLVTKDWDDPAPNEMKEKFISWVTPLDELNKLRIPRHVGANSSENNELYVFCDASEMAYGAVAYLRQGNRLNPIFSKSRLATKVLGKAMEEEDDVLKNELTIARLELQAAVVGAKIVKYLLPTLNEATCKVFCFTDSAITLARIRKGPDAWKIWVGNRVKYIVDICESKNWHYVPTKENPADLVSRGLSAKELIDSELWWRGPRFVTERLTQDWPKIPALEVRNSRVISFEEKPSVQFLTVQNIASDWISNLATRVSTWNRLKNAVVNVLTARNILLSKIQKTPQFQKGILLEAESLIFRSAQKEIDWDKTLTPSCNVFIDEEGVRRLENRAPIFEENLNPIVLPTHNTITELIVLDRHRHFGHAVLSPLLADLYQYFKIIGGRKEVKRILSQCKDKACRTLEPVGQKMSDLPKERLSMADPFQYVALDYFGPLQVITKPFPKKIGKAWGCLFSCLSTRGIHLELVKDMTAKEFLLAFRRFTSRRGLPAKIWSDNAKTFESGAKQLKHLQTHAAVKSHLSRNRIEWIFCSPLSPWSQGVVERMVQNVKKSLTAITHGNTLDIDTLATVFAECENIVNNRPLGVVREMEEAITPSHLIAGRKLLSLPDEANKGERKPSAPNAMWRQRQVVLNKFWKKFSHDYLINQQPRKKWRNYTNSMIKPGDIVVVRDENLSRNDWKLAKVLEIINDRNGIPRYATVQSNNGLPLRRHFERLALLEECNDPVLASAILPIKRSKKKRTNDKHDKTNDDENNSGSDSE